MKPRLISNKLSVALVVRGEGMSLAEIAEQALMWGVAPACCKHHCQVEPDGVCVHGNKSVLVEAGLCL